MYCQLSRNAWEGLRNARIHSVRRSWYSNNLWRRNFLTTQNKAVIKIVPLKLYICTLQLFLSNTALHHIMVTVLYMSYEVAHLSDCLKRLTAPPFKSTVIGVVQFRELLKLEQIKSVRYIHHIELSECQQNINIHHKHYHTFVGRSMIESH